MVALKHNLAPTCISNLKTLIREVAAVLLARLASEIVFMLENF